MIIIKYTQNTYNSFMYIQQSLILKTKRIDGTSGQDGDICKHGLLPHTTTGKITTKLQNNQHSEIVKRMELYGSLTMEELKKLYSPRQVGGVETWKRRKGSHIPTYGG